MAPSEFTVPMSYGSPDCDYDDLVKSWGYEIVAQEDFGSYQGDTAVLLRDGERYGWLVFGWGSCTYCDALQGCASEADVRELREQLHADIHWEDSAAALLQWMSTRDWPAVEFAWHEAGFLGFVSKAQGLLADA